MIALKNKEIFELKLTVATGCNLRCDYCFVDKNRANQEMTLETAQKSIEFFLGSKGKDKILKIYGGEPLLNFEVIKKAVFYAKKTARKKNKNLTLSLCTNAVLLNPVHVDFFKKNKFQLAISFDGSKQTHDKFRKFPNGTGTFDKITENFKFLFKNINRRDMAANMAVVPSEAKNMFKNFKYILNTGFDTLNIEPIYGFEKWTINKHKQFQKEMEFTVFFILSQIYKKNFIFLTTVNRELKYKTLSKLKNGVCLFHQFPEIYPDGRIGFSSFFLNLPQKIQSRYIVGNVNQGRIENKYKNCVYSNKSKKCQNCWENYFNLPDESMSSKVVEIRNLLSIELANYIQQMAQNNTIFREYINEVKKHICF